MKGKNRYKNRRSSKKYLWIAIAVLTIAVIGTIVFIADYLIKANSRDTMEEFLARYMAHIEKREYEEMYQMTDPAGSEYADKEAFINRNSAIYEGIEIKNIQIEITEKNITENEKARHTLAYHMSFDTAAGNIHFENEMEFTEGGDGYRILWNDGLIFPELTASDKVRISFTQAKRGKISDRYDRMLAGPGTAASVGIVPGKLEDRENTLQKLSGLLDIEPERIEEFLNAAWVKEDSFVPVKTIPEVSKLNLMSPEPDEKTLSEKARQDALLAIPGVMLSDVEVREYPYGQAASHLTGYVSSVTAEDLDTHEGEGYTENSVIGRSGLEAFFEKELKGQDGSCIYIEDADGRKKSVLAEIPVQDGQDIRLTIDAQLQAALYQQFQEDPGCSAAMNPYTGEVLALVSTPSYDSNDFILGLSDEKWNSLNEDKRKPLFNRFREIWCPGSTLKPVIAAIGLKTGAVDPQEDYGNVGLSWQKDASWGDYFVTTLHAYEPVTMENALIYSDNIYFAKAALKIGAEALENALKKQGFEEQIPFEIVMSSSQYSNTEHIETEILPADAAAQVLEGMKKVVNDPEGTGYAAHSEEVLLAGKTGTAEIKTSIEDTNGTEIGWFAVFTAEKDVEEPVLIVSMVENVKDIGGSGYVVNKDKAVLDWYLN